MTGNLPDLRVTVDPVPLKNPALAVSGTFGYGQEYSPIMDTSPLGGIAFKGLTLRPRAGNSPSRIHETHCGTLNAEASSSVFFFEQPHIFT